MKKLIMFIVAIFVSCNNVITIDQSVKKKYDDFNKLPDTVKYFMKELFEKKRVYNDSILTYSIDKNVDFEYLKKKQKPWIFEEFNTQFKINNQIYKISGNIKDPYIFYDGKLFFPDLYAHYYNYLEKNFYSINLKNTRNNKKKLY